MLRAYRALIHACAVIAALALGLMAVLVTFDVLARNIGLGQFPWIVELSEYSLPFATFLMAPWLLHRNEHIRLDVLINAMQPAVLRCLNQIVNLIGLAVCAVFVGYGSKTIVDSAAQGALVVKAIVMPEWWLYVPVPFCFSLLAAEFLRRMCTRS
jgi:TRAP-type C4-dicarboxylate transport system permease small subunit